MNKYALYDKDRLEELFSNYLIDSWSYSKVSTFARNEKAFEMLYVYRETEKRSISSIAGNAYHCALAEYFKAFNAERKGLVDLTAIAYEYLDELPANEWKLTDKFNSIDLAKIEATRQVNALLQNFVSEIDTYTENIAEVLQVEEKESAWVTVNGVDIPLPLHYVADLVARTFDGKTVIIDHKSKSAYTGEDEVVLTHGQQAITYALGYESIHEDSKIDEVWFIENKVSQNKDKSAQLRKHVLELDTDSRRLYEYYLYQPLRRMIQATSDPDYIYVINNGDNLSDKATIYEFSTRTLIAEVDDFEHIPEEKKELIRKRQRKIKDSSVAMISPAVITKFRRDAASFITFDYTHSNMTPSEKIEHAFRTFGKQVRVAHEIEGFSCTTYLCEVAAGVKISELKSYTLDIANALDVPSVRIAGQLVMHEGRSFLAIEVNNKSRNGSLNWDLSYLEDKKIPLGLDNFHQPVVWNIANQSTPHMLVCGASGSGKSVMLRSTIKYAQAAGIEDIVILDPKYEFAELNGTDGISVFSDIEDIETALEGMVGTMQAMVKNKQKKLRLVIFDEFADAQDQSKELHRRDKENPTMPLEVSFKMLLQKGRSCGFRFVAATQRADTKTISGTTRANFAVLVCFRMPKAADSRVILDEDGANALFGGGDGLVKSPEYMDQIIRFQGFYVEQ